ncbi:MAG: ketopantoate reductase family protein [Anaerolineae bacterium]
MTAARQILIAGTGAMATLFAWRLASAGNDVTMLGTWQPGLEALAQRGARLVDARGNEAAVPVRVTRDPAACKGARQAIVLVKAWQTARVAEQLRQSLAADGLAVTVQNGLGNYEVLASALRKERVALGTTTTGATLLGPGLVKPAGNGSISIQSHERLAPLAAALTASGFKVNVVPDAHELLWAKLVINSAINPLTALLRVQNGELLERPTARALMRALAQESAAVAAAEGVQLAGDDPAALVEEVARQTAGNYSSMLQDIQRGAPTEIDAICGAITRAGQRHGLPTPLNEAFWRLVAALTPVAAEVVRT